MKIKMKIKISPLLHYYITICEELSHIKNYRSDYRAHSTIIYIITASISPIEDLCWKTHTYIHTHTHSGAVKEIHTHIQKYTHIHSPLHPSLYPSIYPSIHLFVSACSLHPDGSATATYLLSMHTIFISYFYRCSTIFPLPLHYTLHQRIHPFIRYRNK